LDVYGKATFSTAALAPAVHPVQASYTGNLAFAASSGDLVGGQQVDKLTAGVTLTGLSQIYNNSPRTIGADTNPPGLTVIFDYNGQPTAPTNAGSYPVSGTISDPVYAGSASGTLVITPADSTIQLVSSLTSVLKGQAVIFTATVSVAQGLPTPTGTVIFTIGGVPQPAVALDANGVATLTTTALPVGSVQVSASYPGSTNYAPSGPATLQVNVQYGIFLPLARK
jgi:hypothetical protein